MLRITLTLAAAALLAGCESLGALKESEGVICYHSNRPLAGTSTAVIVKTPPTPKNGGVIMTVDKECQVAFRNAGGAQ